MCLCDLHGCSVVGRVSLLFTNRYHALLKSTASTNLLDTNQPRLMLLDPIEDTRLRKMTTDD